MFVSIIFLIGLGITAALFFVLPRKWRPVLLLIASYVFCCQIDTKALLVLIGISLYVWIAGLMIERKRETKKREGTGKNYLILSV